MGMAEKGDAGDVRARAMTNCEQCGCGIHGLCLGFGFPDHRGMAYFCGQSCLDGWCKAKVEPERMAEIFRELTTRSTKQREDA